MRQADRLRTGAGRRGLAISDLVLALAGVVLLFAALLPTIRARGVDNVIQRAESDVATLRAASERYFAERGRWPSQGAPGALPPEVATAFPGVTELRYDEYSVQWMVLEMLDERDAPPGTTILPTDADAAPDSVGPRQIRVPTGIGGIVVRSSRDEILAALLERYGARTSFARDSSWTLIVGAPPRG